MRIIAMQGEANTGKTTTIRKAYDSFCTTTSVVVPFRFRGNNVDFEAVLKTRDGKKVGFFSQGDCGEDVAHNIVEAENAGCDILVTAVRTKGATLDNICQYRGQSIDHEVLLVRVIDMYADSNPSSLVYDNINKFSAISDLMAKHLLNVLEHVLRVI